MYSGVGEQKKSEKIIAPLLCAGCPIMASGWCTPTAWTNSYLFFFSGHPLVFLPNETLIRKKEYTQIVYSF